MVPQQLESDWPPANWIDVHVVIAVSGGADSVALLRAITDLKQSHGGSGTLIVAHLNHGLRGDESDADQRSVEDLCDQLQLPLKTDRVDTKDLAAVAGDGIESAARDARLAFLRRTAESSGARFVVTGHTADDQVETVLFRILRGTGIAGLRGIRRLRRLGPSVTLIRPLLSVSRSEILTYLQRLGQSFREDASNRDASFARNRIRHRLLPALRAEFNPEIDGAIAELARQADAVQRIMDGASADLAGAAVSRSEAGVTIDGRQLAGVDAFLVAEVCRGAWRQAGWPEQSMTHRHWRRLATMLITGQDDPHTLPGCVQAAMEGHVLSLTR